MRRKFQQVIDILESQVFVFRVSNSKLCAFESLSLSGVESSGTPSGKRPNELSLVSLNRDCSLVLISLYGSSRIVPGKI